MREFPFSDRAAFWLGVAGVLAAIGIVPVTIAVAGKPPGADFWSDRAFLFGILIEAVALVALWWAITLHIAHGHATDHATGAGTRARSEPFSPPGSAPDEPPARAISQDPQPSPASIAVAPRSKAKRTYVDVDGDYLRGFFKELSGIQATKLVAPYLNSWMRVSGTVASLSDFTQLAQMTLAEKPGLYLYFVDRKWIGPLSRLRLNVDTVTVDGKIEKIRGPWIDLHECELVDPT
jgi:hypothetical protein